MSAQTVHAAPFFSRVGAFLLDGLIAAGLAYAVVLSSAVVSSSLGDRGPDWVDVLWVAPAVAVVVGYFAFGYARGQTVGLRATELHIQRVTTAAPPAWPRAIVRAVETTLFIVSPLVLVVYGFSDPPASDYGTIDRTLLIAAAATFAVTLLGNFWMLVDPARRTLQDRIAGVAVIEAGAARQAGPPPTAAPA